MDSGLSTTGGAEAALDATAVVGDPVGIETRPRDLQEGATVGRYVILESIGEGGMGKVYLAEDPELGRRVAIKILRTSRGGARLNRMSNRLLREAQAIAKLSHPNIVAVYDVGRCDSGVFIAMEYVRGQSLREWLDEKERSVDEILDVFIPAARALGAAHEEGIVHRDIKPDNIRFDAKGRLKILDFGLARATIDVDLTAGDSFDEADHDEPARPDSLLSAEMTQAGHIVGTPAYMSPEQYRGAIVVPASDQFSLCVTLFEALYGQRPFRGVSAADVGRARELGVSFPERASVPAAIRRVLQQGLEVLPHKRFASMDALGDALHKIRHRTRRRALTVGGVGLGGVLVGGGLIAAMALDQDPCQQGTQLRVWNEHRGELQRRFESGADQVASEAWPRVAAALDDYAKRWSEARVEACTATTQGDQPGAVMDLRMSCLDRHQQAVKALIHTLADGAPGTLARAGSMVAELPDLQSCRDVDALRLLPPIPKDDDLRRRVFEARAGLAEVAAWRAAARYDAAREGLARLEPVIVELGEAPVQAELEVERAHLLSIEGDHVGAEKALRDALRHSERVPYPRLRAEVYLELAGTLSSGLSRYEAAQEAIESAEATIEGQGRPDDLLARLALARADLFAARDRYPEARRIYEKLLDREPVNLSRDALLERLAVASTQDIARRQELYEELIGIRRERYGPHHPGVASALAGLGGVLTNLRELDEARERFNEALEIRKRVFGPDSVPVAQSFSSLGVIAIHAEDYDTAAKRFEHAIRLLEAHDEGQAGLDLVTVRSNLAIVYSRRGEQKRAREIHLDALEQIERADPDHPRRSIPFINIGLTYEREGRLDEALQWATKAARLLEGIEGEASRSGDMRTWIGDLHRKRGELAEARSAYERALGHYERGDNKLSSPSRVRAHVGLGEVALESGDEAFARTQLETALSKLAERDDSDDPTSVRAKFHLARALWSDREQRPRALELAREASDDHARLTPDDEETGKAIARWLAAHP